jgi:hypothetical protein
MGTMMLTVLTTASESATEAAKATAAAGGAAGPGAVLLGVIALLLGSSVVANSVTAVMTNLRASAETRRQHYATAVELLAARIEFPYRIRRRTDNNRETLAKLAEMGHDLQQRLAQSRAWVTAENAVVGRVFDACVAALDAPFKAACHEAWESEPVTEPAQMNLNGFGMGEQADVVTSMQCALVYRFGWRRAIPSTKLSSVLTSKGCLAVPAQPPAQQGAQTVQDAQKSTASPADGEPRP